MPADTELTKAIADATAEITGEKPPVEDKKEDKADEGNEVELEVEEDEKESDDEPDLTESELDEANRLYKALRNPKTSGPIVAALAAQAGLHLTPESTKTEVREVKKSIQDKVADALGEQYKFLAPQLGKAIEAALEDQREENKASLQEIRQAQIERDVTTAYNQLARETKGESKKLEARMANLSEEIPIGNMSVDTYIRRLYSVATSESQKTTAKQTADKIRRNAGDAPSRLRGTSAGTEPKIPDKKMGLKESVNFALEELTKQGR